MSVRALMLFPILAILSVAARAAEPALLVEDLECRGNQHTSCDYILTHLYLRAGDALDEEEIQNARFRLSALPNFTEVVIYLEKGSQRGNVRVVIEVTEASPIGQEWLLGASNRMSSVSPLLATRISHQNLFGAGEILDFVALTQFPADGPEREVNLFRLQYVDRTAFSSDKYFLIAGASYLDEHVENKFDVVQRSRQWGFDLSIGRRLWDFSYLSIGYAYLPTSTRFVEFTQKDGDLFLDEESFHHTFLVDYGWNSEDDPYFPSQGSRFQASVAVNLVDSHVSSDPERDGDTGGRIQAQLGFRKTWSDSHQNIWTFKIGTPPASEYRAPLEESQGLTFTYARSLAQSGVFSGAARRARWYVEAGLDFTGYAPDGPTFTEVGVKAGLRLDTHSFGIVDLYLLATTDVSSETAQ